VPFDGELSGKLSGKLSGGLPVNHWQITDESLAAR
jgi:uncharacterized protein YgfB (UPF0149 family)